MYGTQCSIPTLFTPGFRSIDYRCLTFKRELMFGTQCSIPTLFTPGFCSSDYRCLTFMIHFIFVLIVHVSMRYCLFDFHSQLRERYICMLYD
jgi:hypothetical protein